MTGGQFAAPAHPDASLLRAWGEYVAADRAFRAAADVDGSDEALAHLSERLCGLRDRVVTMPAVTVSGWSCKLKLALLQLTNLNELAFNADSFDGAPPTEVAEPECLEDQGRSWIWNVIGEMDRGAEGGPGPSQGNRVKGSCGDKACKEVVVPGCDLAAEA
ncbi:MAG: hypothetical protein HQL37_03600 [Alphaproteobacteria bacterium]|nr:hypothetical protein [Alphaproteobacteria bacterium]